MKKSKALASILCAAALCSNMIMPSMLTASAAETDVTTFTFTDSGITVSNEKDTNYSIKGTQLTINGNGSYRVTGSCSDGSIKVKKSTSDVTLTLSDLTLTCAAGAPIVCAKNSQADIVINGTVNLSDTVENCEDYWTDQGYTDSDSEVEDAENAVVKIKGASKITMSGDGTLNITAHAKNGIKSGATLDSELENELAADPESDYYAYLTMEDLTVNIDTTDVYIPTSSQSTTNNQQFGRWGMETSSNTYGDGINAESCLNIVSGTYNISAGDDGIHSDYVLNIGSSGAADDLLDININKSYEGIEAATINFYSGDIDVIASDDAVNAANGDLTKYDFAMNIYGGNIYADASSGNDNDGLDSNGSINVYGGTVIALADRSGNAFDLETTFNVYGGTLLGLGASPMDGEKLNSSTQQTWAVWTSGNSGGFSGRGGRGGRGSSSTAKTNISAEDQSKVTLMIGDTSYSVGSSISGAASGSKVAVMLNGTQEIISTTAKADASYITFAGDIGSSAAASSDTDSTGVTTDTPAPTDSDDNPTQPGFNDSDRPTPPGFNDSDRPTPPGFNDSDRPTPPEFDDSDRPEQPEPKTTDDVPEPPTTEDTDKEPDTLLFGDSNQDGTIDSSDAISILRYSLSLETLSERELLVADVNRDGTIDSADALLIIRASVGLNDDMSWAGLYKTMKEILNV